MDLGLQRGLGENAKMGINWKDSQSAELRRVLDLASGAFGPWARRRPEKKARQREA